MTTPITQARRILRERLVRCRDSAGGWEGCLSPSAVATATAVSALALHHRMQPQPRPPCPEITAGVAWLLRSSCSGGGWGDTPESPANLSATALSLAALRLAKATGPDAQPTVDRALRFMQVRTGGEPLNRALSAVYGADRTFAVPILMNCALAGMVAWRTIPPLPYALALLPAVAFRLPRLRVVSYALPALIGVGLRLEKHQSNGRLRKWWRARFEPRLLCRLDGLQPARGGFLEATPLTAFVTMALMPNQPPAPPVVRRGIDFLRQSMRADGGWPIDTHLSLWVTSHAIQVLSASPDLAPPQDLTSARHYLSAAQTHTVHPATRAPAGGWAWTPLDGGVPDTDDTAAALLALRDTADAGILTAGVRWLLSMQNRDGGWPTFCRGWGHLPFDRSSPDLTAHALRALTSVQQRLGPTSRRPLSAVPRAIRRGLAYLASTQQADGAWIPLWFGSQHTTHHTNPVLGTALVLKGIAGLTQDRSMTDRGLDFLCLRQNGQGLWGADTGISPTLEETSGAVAALARHAPHNHPHHADALVRGARALAECIACDPELHPAPIGLYFADLWYSEALYPILWSLEALNAAAATTRQTEPAAPTPAAPSTPSAITKAGGRHIRQHDIFA